MGDLFGALQNASAAAPRTMPCFNGFGLPLCTQQAADKNGYSGSGWTPAMPNKYDVRDAMLCLQCCSSGHEFYDALDDRWSLRCRTGNWDVTVPAQWAAGQPLKLLNPFTKVPTRVPVPAGKGPGSMFRIVVGAMPPLSQYDRWEFRFLKREEEGDGATLVSCPLRRANRSRYVAGYTLRLLTSAFSYFYLLTHSLTHSLLLYLLQTTKVRGGVHAAADGERAAARGRHVAGGGRVQRHGTGVGAAAGVHHGDGVDVEQRVPAVLVVPRWRLLRDGGHWVDVRVGDLPRAGQGPAQAVQGARPVAAYQAEEGRAACDARRGGGGGGGGGRSTARLPIYFILKSTSRSSSSSSSCCSSDWWCVSGSAAGAAAASKVCGPGRGGMGKMMSQLGPLGLSLNVYLLRQRRGGGGVHSAQCTATAKMNKMRNHR